MEEHPLLDSKQIWQTALDQLQLAMTRGNYDTWLKDTWAIDFDGNTFVVGVENPFAKEWLEGRFAGVIRKTLSELLGQPTQVRFVSQRRAASTRQAAPLPLQSAAGEERPPAARPASPRPLVVGSPLNPRYTFETFVVGNSNRLAHAASRAVADRPGHAYNPLFIYGGVGLGKTHLLHAIGHAVARQGLTVVYVSSETFTNELIDSIRRQQMEEFRQKYRSTPLLLIDDIQFIAGKERTEEEFFHTFNAIHEAGGQVVLSSDRPPKAMTVLQERLQSRFAMGLIADVQPPDFETRLAILRSKTHGQVVPDEVLEYVAHRIQSNIRELEGSLTRILAYAQLHERPVTVELAAEALKDVLLDGARPVIQPEAIVQAVSRYYGVTPEALRGKARDKKIVTPRQVAMYLLREDAKLSLPDIGAVLGGRDHTTVLHGVRAVQHEIDREGPVRADLKGIRESYRALEAQ